MGKAFFIDLTLCTACRGCQVACKQWKKLPAEKTRNTGSHTNPPDLSYNTYKTVHFVEKGAKNDLRWLFFPEQCRHCLNPGCKASADADKEGAIIQDPNTGAVIYTELTRQVDGASARESCPYDIPRIDPATKQMAKCDMCPDRIAEGLLPACVLTCNTGCMSFGDEDEMREKAKKHLEEAKKRWPNAVLGDIDYVRTIYLYQEDPLVYHKHAVMADAGSPAPLPRRSLLAGLLKGRKG